MHISVFSKIVRIIGILFVITLLITLMSSFSLASHAASPAVELTTADSTDKNGYYAIKLIMTDITISSKKNIDVSIIYNNMAFSIVKAEFSSSVKSYASSGKSGDNPYHIKITAGSSTLKPSGTVCTLYFEPIGIPEVKDYVIRATIGGDVSASASNGEIQVKCAHKYVKESTESPSCTSGGYTLEKCTECGGYRQNNKTEPLGHQYEKTGTVAPNCTQNGYSVMECVRCGFRTTEEGEAPLGHEYGFGASSVVEPTCANKGYTEYKCLRDDCGYILRTDYTDTVDHVRGDVVTVPSTCQKHGSENIYCVHCGLCLEEKRLDLVPHEFDDTVVAPTCTSRGYTLRICRACNTIRRENSVDMTEHSYNTVIERQADCTSAGRKKFVCECGESYTEEIEPLGHDYVKESVIDATEESDGMINYICSVCGDARPQIIPAGSISSGPSDTDKTDDKSEFGTERDFFVKRLVLSVMLALVVAFAVSLIVLVLRILIKKIAFVKKRSKL